MNNRPQIEEVSAKRWLVNRRGGLEALSAWLTSQSVSAAAMEGTGIYWRTPWDRLRDAGIEVHLLHVQHVKHVKHVQHVKHVKHVKQLRGRKTDVEDGHWLARVCQFGLGRRNVVPDRQFHALRSLNRHRRSLVHERARLRNRTQKTIDRAGIRIGGIISNLFGVNGRIMLEGLAAGDSREDILSRLSAHVSGKLAALRSALRLSLADWECALLVDLMAAEAAVRGRINAVETAMLE